MITDRISLSPITIANTAAVDYNTVLETDEIANLDNASAPTRVVNVHIANLFTEPIL